MNSNDVEMLRRIAIANSETALVNCRVAAMQAENAMRELRGGSPAYTKENFDAEEQLLHYHPTLLQW